MKENLEFFREMLSNATNISFMTLDAEYGILYSNAPHLEVFTTFFQLNSGCQQMIEHGKIQPEDTESYRGQPVITTNTVGMAWLSDIEYRGREIEKIHIIGPVFLDDYSPKLIEAGLERLQLSVKMRHQFMDIIRELPIVSLNRLYEYGSMLHFCLTGEKIGASDFVYADTVREIPEEMLEEKHGSYMAETNILKLVEEGNLGYKEEMEKIKAGNVGKFADGDYLRQAKNTVIVFCGLCARAAVKGGIAPEISYVLREQYIRRTENANCLAEVTKVNADMLDEYVRRVHQAKNVKDISPAIRECCDYITLQLKEKTDIHTLATKFGYTDYYFSDKFKKEMGISVREYTMQKKIEKAKEYLKYSNLTIQDISDELGFNTASHFGRVFKEQTGVSPGEYRER